jgi:(2Fe-2S) ferredoxin
MRHVFLCAEATKPKCAPPEVGRPVWEHLKQRVKELGLDAAKPAEGQVPGHCILRTKADCLRVCNDGPIAVVYPDGVWYRGVTVPVMERILVEHILGGRPVESHVLVRAPLG